MEKKVIVTGIGGNVGQGVIRNIKKTGFNIKVIGTNVTSFSAGNHLCDLFYKVSYAYNRNYIDEIISIVNNERVDLIIPTTDFEVYFLSKNIDKIPCDVAVSKIESATNYLDKFLTFQFLNKHNIPFAESYLPSKFNREFNDYILKPRKGRGSRGIKINPVNYSDFNDEEYMVQELHKGREITTSFYVKKDNSLHSFITLDRVLENGTTTHCKVVDDHDEKLKKILETLIEKSGIRGAANLQSIVNKKGEIFPFEINCRISGTNSIRSNFGFEDVKYTLEEWLYKTQLSKPKIKKGIATRILMDVIYIDETEFENAKTNKSNHFIF